MAPPTGSKSNAKTVCAAVSAQYIVRPSGLQARPLLIVIPDWRRSRRPSRKHQRPARPGRRGSSIEPTQKRPAGSHLPSLKRSSVMS